MAVYKLYKKTGKMVRGGFPYQGQGVAGVWCRAFFGVREEILIFGEIFTSAILLTMCHLNLPAPPTSSIFTLPNATLCN